MVEGGAVSRPRFCVFLLRAFWGAETAFWGGSYVLLCAPFCYAPFGAHNWRNFMNEAKKNLPCRSVSNEKSRRLFPYATAGNEDFFLRFFLLNVRGLESAPPSTTPPPCPPPAGGGCRTPQNLRVYIFPCVFIHSNSI